MNLFKKAVSVTLDRCVCSEPHIWAPPRVGDRVVCLSYPSFDPTKDDLKPGDTCVIDAVSSESVSHHPYCGVCRKQVMDEWDYYTVSLRREGDGHRGERHWQSLEYDVWRGECSPFRRRFNHEESLSAYEKQVLEATRDLKLEFRVYEEGNTGQLRIFWKSNHPSFEDWVDVGSSNRHFSKPVYYRAMEHVDHVLSLIRDFKDIRDMLRFRPTTGFEDVIYGKLLKEVTP